MNNKKVKVQITYEWEFDMKDWMDLNAHEEKVKEIMKQKQLMKEENKELLKQN